MSEPMRGALCARRRRVRVAGAVMGVLLAGFPYLADAHTFKDPNSPYWPGGAACSSGQVRNWRLNTSSPWISSADVIAASQAQCNDNIANLGYGHCQYSTTFGVNSGTVAQSHQYKANSNHVIDPYVRTYQTYASQCQAAPKVLSLQAGGQVAAGQALYGQRVQVTAAGSPVANLPVRISALRRDPLQPPGTLSPSAGEGAACGPSGATLDCTTDADGVIDFEFMASPEEQVRDALHDVTVTCSDPTKPCSPNQTEPSLITVTGCPVTLTLGGGGSVPARKVLEGQEVSVRNCRGEARVDVEVAVVATPIEPVLAPAGALRLEGSSDPGSSAIYARTDANGEIALEFLAPDKPGTHEIAARCTSALEPCTPDPDREPITVSPCAATLELRGPNAVQPDRELPGFVLEAKDCEGDPAQNLWVEISPSVQALTGNHNHDDQQRPLGEIASSNNCSPGSAPNAVACETDMNGQINFSFVAPKVSGRHDLAAACAAYDSGRPCNEAGPNAIDVFVDGLVLIEQPPAGELQYYYIGQPVDPEERDEHPQRHYLTRDAMNVLNEISAAYMDQIGEALCINDASLPDGGVFDLGAQWGAPHEAHSCGTAVDIAGKVNNPAYECEVFGSVNGRDKQAAFEEIYARHKVTQQLDRAHRHHYHLYLLRGNRFRRSALPCTPN